MRDVVAIECALQWGAPMSCPTLVPGPRPHLGRVFRHNPLPQLLLAPPDNPRGAYAESFLPHAFPAVPPSSCHQSGPKLQ